MILEKYIEELLHRHDCVIIPGFGGFIGSYSPAKIRRNDQFLPPSKSILFNVNLIQNDGLLANHISSGENMTYQEAMDLITDETDIFRNILVHEKRLKLGRIGEIHVEDEDILRFHQNPFVNFLPDAYGLSGFVSHPVKREVLPEGLTEEKSSVAAGFMKWAAMLALPLGIAAYMSFYQFDRIKEFSASYSGIFFSPSADSKPTVPAKSFIMPAPHKNPVPVSVQVLAKETEHPVINTADNFAIIVGAFRFPENAAAFIAELQNKGFRAAVYDKSRTGLTRVTIGTYPTKKEALEQLASVRANHPGAWLLSK